METEKGRYLKKKGVRAVLVASGHTGKDRDLVVKFAVMENSGVSDNCIFQGQ